MTNSNRPSVINQTKRPLLVCVVSDTTPDGCIATIRNAIYDGADGIMLDLAKLEKQYHTVEDLHRIIDYTENKPVITMNYRYGNANRAYVNDEELVESLLISVSAGASMCDVMGDMFNMSPMEMAYDQKTIEKQKKLVDEMHNLGSEVMLSSHTWVPMTTEQTIEHARALESRGADMIKIAMCVLTEDELLEAIKTTAIMKRELEVPYLHVCMGQFGKIHRVISSVMGSMMVLCVQEYTVLGHKEQLLLRATRDVYNNLNWHAARDTLLGTIKPQIPTGE